MLFNIHLQGPVQLYNVTHVLGELTHISSDCILVLNYILTTSLPEVFHYLRCASLIPAVSHLFALGIQLFAGQSAPFMKLIKPQAEKISAIFIPKRKISFENSLRMLPVQRQRCQVVLRTIIVHVSIHLKILQQSGEKHVL